MLSNGICSCATGLGFSRLGYPGQPRTARARRDAERALPVDDKGGVAHRDVFGGDAQRDLGERLLALGEFPLAGGERGAMPWFSTMANGYYVLTDYDGRPKPTMMAYSALEQQLDGAAPCGKHVRNGLTAHLFSKGSGAVAVVWGERERSLVVEGASVLDLMGNEEGEPKLRPGEPVFVVAPRLVPEQLVARLK